MLEYLDNISEELGRRRETLCKNIGSGSSSFYVSYRSLCEEYLRFVLTDGCFQITQKDNVTSLLSNDDIISYLTDKLKCEYATVAKIKNLILKINKQVHSHEKAFDDTLVVTYINTLYDFTAPFAHFKKIPTLPPSNDDIISACNSHEREVEEVREECEQNSREMLDDIKVFVDGRFDKIEEEISIINEHTKQEAERARREENERLMLERARTIDYVKKNSNPINLYVPVTGDEFGDKKRRLIYLSLFILLSSVPHVILSVNICDLYSTFTFLSNLWHLLILFFLRKLIFTKEAIFTNRIDSCFPVLASRCDDSYIPFSLKRRYLVLLTLYIIGAVADCATPFYYKPLSGVGEVFCYVCFIILLLCGTVASIMLYREAFDFYTNYIATVFRSNLRDENNNPITFVKIVNKTLSESEFIKQYRAGQPIKYPEN